MRKLTFEEITARRLSPGELREMERFPIYALLDNIRSLYNVGSIFRTSDAVRLKKLYLTGITGHPPRREINKTALGAVETVPWQYEENPLPILETLKEEGVRIIVLEHTSRSRPFNEIKYQFPLCLVVGNEVFGVREEIVELADQAIEIPMFGTKQSLNVTIAYGIAVYEILLQFLKQKGNNP